MLQQRTLEGTGGQSSPMNPLSPVASEAATPSSVDAGQARVTPDEAARALAAIEARRQQAQANDARTIPLAEVIQQFSLNVSPEEMLAEVEAQRQGIRQTAAETVRRRKRRRILSVAAAAVVVIGLGFDLAYLRSSPAPVEMAPTAAPPVFASDANRLKMTLEPDTLVQDTLPNGKPILRSFGEIAEGHEVRATMSSGSDQEGSVALMNNYGEIDGRHGWRVVKFNGQPYIRGFVTPTSEAGLRGHEATLFAERTAEAGGSDAMPVTLPFSGFGAVVGPDDGRGTPQTSFIATDVQTDQHLHDKWSATTPHANLR